MSDIRDFSGKNRKFTGTDSIVLPKGATGSRVNTTGGQLRYNTTTNLAEYYNGTEWKPIDSPPTVTGVSPGEVASADGSTTSFTITGGNFQSGATVKFIGNDGTEVTASTVTVNSSSSITAVESSSSFANAKEPYDVKITNASGLSASLDDSVNVDNAPTWTTAAGSLGSIQEDATGTHFTVAATDADGDTVSYSEVTDVLTTQAGLTLNSTTGVISGDPTNGQATYNFTLRATANSKTADRAFSITVNAVPSGGTISTYTYSSTTYKVHTFSSSGSFTLPSGKTVDILVTAGGGAGGGGQGSNYGAGGGAGGVVWRAGKALNAATYTVTVGGTQAWSDSQTSGNTGNNSVFTGDGYTLTGNGGGGGSGVAGPTPSSANGGSGGGAGRDAGNNAAGSATQGNGGDASATGYGNAGGIATGTGCTSAGGGGGAGGVGQNGCFDCQTARQGTCSAGGVGITNFINSSTAETAAMLWSAQIGTNSSNQLVTGLGSNPGTIYIAGGGGGSYEVDNAGELPPGGIGGGGRGGSRYPNGGGQQGTSGLTNTGGGGGAGQRYNNGGQGGGGAAGHVIIRYTA